MHVGGETLSRIAKVDMFVENVKITNVEKKTFFWKDLPNCNWLEQKIMQVSKVDQLGHFLFILI